MLSHKGYVGKVEYDDEAEIFHGDVINTRDVITFQADNAHDLKQAFIESVEDYLDFCAQNNEEADKPFSGQFMLRVDPDIHRRAYIKSKMEEKSLNALVSEALNVYLTYDISNKWVVNKSSASSRLLSYKLGGQEVEVIEKRSFRRSAMPHPHGQIRVVSRKIRSGAA